MYALRKYQYFLQTDWPGGVYGSPTMAGSRPGALSAGCWATMVHMGYSGYVEATKKILTAAQDIRKGISGIDGLKVIGEPRLSVVAFTTTGSLKIYAIAELLSKREYHLNVLQFPPSIHIACTMLTPPLVKTLLADLAEIVLLMKKDPELGNGAKAAIYGTAATVPDRNIIGDVVCGFLDGLTKMPEQGNPGMGEASS
ncbi:Sphingosine-1-phosphate lyase 1 [Kappamyces sp. JEL0680]|nr:Sphingosine-1-phosphate lyase 1 [Kappamyces sp. JEL0680]